jgi:hypothetical protein
MAKQRPENSIAAMRRECLESRLWMSGGSPLGSARATNTMASWGREELQREPRDAMLSSSTRHRHKQDGRALLSQRK